MIGDDPASNLPQFLCHYHPDTLSFQLSIIYFKTKDWGIWPRQLSHYSNKYYQLRSGIDKLPIMSTYESHIGTLDVRFVDSGLIFADLY